MSFLFYFILNKIYLFFRNIEEILAEKGQTVKKFTVDSESAFANSTNLKISSSNIELIIDEHSSKIFQTQNENTENEK